MSRCRPLETRFVTKPYCDRRGSVKDSAHSRERRGSPRCLVRAHYLPKGHAALADPVEGFADSCRRVTSDHGTQTSVCESCGHGAFEIRMLCCASELCVACLEKERGVCPFC